MNSSPSRPILYVCHADDMFRAHPQTIWDRTCSLCQGRVGIYPSGQAALKQHPDILIICNRCHMMHPLEVIEKITPEIIKEMTESKPRQP